MQKQVIIIYITEYRIGTIKCAWIPFQLFLYKEMSKKSRKKQR